MLNSETQQQEVNDNLTDSIQQGEESVTKSSATKKAMKAFRKASASVIMLAFKAFVIAVVFTYTVSAIQKLDKGNTSGIHAAAHNAAVQLGWEEPGILHKVGVKMGLVEPTFYEKAKQSIDGLIEMTPFKEKTTYEKVHENVVNFFTYLSSKFYMVVTV